MRHFFGLFARCTVPLLVAGCAAAPPTPAVSGSSATTKATTEQQSEVKLPASASMMDLAARLTESARRAGLQGACWFVVPGGPGSALRLTIGATHLDGSLLCAPQEKEAVVGDRDLMLRQLVLEDMFAGPARMSVDFYGGPGGSGSDEPGSILGSPASAPAAETVGLLEEGRAAQPRGLQVFAFEVPP